MDAREWLRQQEETGDSQDVVQLLEQFAAAVLREMALRIPSSNGTVPLSDVVMRGLLLDEAAQLEGSGR
jgi:hypothetical protein